MATVNKCPATISNIDEVDQAIDQAITDALALVLPSTSTDEGVVRFNGTTGVVQNSGVTIDDSNNVLTTGSLGAGISTLISVISSNITAVSSEPLGLMAGFGNNAVNIQSTGAGNVDITAGSSGSVVFNSPVDVGAGAIDGTIIGASSASTGAFTTANATTVNATTVNATTVNATTVNATGVYTGTRGIFNRNGTVTAAISTLPTVLLSDVTTPLLVFDESGESADNKIWDIRSSAGSLLFNSWNDAFNTVGTVLRIDRTGTTPNGIHFFGNSTGEKLTLNECVVDNLNLNGNNLTSTSLGINIFPLSGQNVTLDCAAGGHVNISNGGGGNIVLLPDGGGNTLITNGVINNGLLSIGGGINGDIDFISAGGRVTFDGLNNELRQSADNMLLDGTNWVRLRESGTNTVSASTGSGGVYLNQYTTNGTLSTNGGVGQILSASDRRLKMNEKPLTYGLAEIMQLQPKFFEWNQSPGDIQVGLIAQDVELVIKEAVDGKKYDYEIERFENNQPIYKIKNGAKQIRPRGMNDRALIAVLIKAVQELTTRVVTLETV